MLLALEVERVLDELRRLVSRTYTDTCGYAEGLPKLVLVAAPKCFLVQIAVSKRLGRLGPGRRVNGNEDFPAFLIGKPKLEVF